MALESELTSKRLPQLQRVSGWFALPAFFWYLGFLFIPMIIVMIYSLATKGPYGGIVYRWSTESYQRAAEWIYLKVLFNSLVLAAGTTAGCLLLGYPLAYVMATASIRMRPILLALVVVPFWTNFVVRAYATKVLFAHWDPSFWIVGVGMVMNYLPFMVLPLFVSLEKFDFMLLEAARDLGASPWRVALKVLLPLTQRGIVTGIVLVFTPALGEFVIPDLLGGARTLLIGNLMTEQFLKTRDWPFGSALSLILILTVVLSMSVYFYFEKGEKRELISYGS